MMYDDDWYKKYKRKCLKEDFLFWFLIFRIVIYAIAEFICIINALGTQSAYYAAMAVFFLLMLKWEIFGK